MTYFIKCNNCNWSYKTQELKKDIEDLKLIEIKNECSNCGKIRKFKCRKCGFPSKIFKI